MKKSLVVLAVLAVSGTAMAQSSVTLYGVVDAGFGVKKWIDAGVTVAKSSGVVDSITAGNRFGFRGTEDLGGGLKAEFVIEQGFSMTSQQLTDSRTASSGFQIDGLAAARTGRSATSLNRQSYAGLLGNFGTVRIGYQYTNLYELATLSGYTLSTESLHGGDVAHLAQTYGGTRANGLTYISPSFSGFTVRAQYGAGTNQNTFESTTAGVTQLKENRASLMGQYANGPLSVAIAHTTYKNGTAVAPVAITTLTNKVTQLGASYDFGVAKLGGTYMKANNGGSGAAEVDTKGYQLGVSVPFGALAVIAAMGRSDVDTGVTRTRDAKTWQLGVNYNLSKRTQMFAYTGSTKDSAVGGIDKKTNTVAGMRHSF